MQCVMWCGDDMHETQNTLPPKNRPSCTGPCDDDDDGGCDACASGGEGGARRKGKLLTVW